MDQNEPELIPPTIRLKTLNNKPRPVEVADVVCVIGEGNYARYYLADNSSCLMARTLLVASEGLPTDFLRIHKQNLINPAYIHRVNSDGGTVTLRSGKVLAISRRYWQQVRLKLAPWYK